MPAGAGSGAGRWSRGCSASPTSTLEHDLLFERFLNPERVSMPDFDVDFCMEAATASSSTSPAATGRERVSADHHLRHDGGEGGGARRRPRARLSYGFADRIAKLIPFELDITLDDALEKEPEPGKRYTERGRECPEVIDPAPRSRA